MEGNSSKENDKTKSEECLHIMLLPKVENRIEIDSNCSAKMVNFHPCINWKKRSQF